MIPLVALPRQYIHGPAVQQFEERFARFCQIRHCVGCSSGTAAIHLALLSVGVGPGDEVITVPNTYIGTTNPILYTGASIRFVDVQPDTALIDINQLEKAITGKTKAVVVVDLYGQMPDMQHIKEITDKHDLFLIEDACQAHGAEWNGHPPGYYSDLACYSFYPSKNLGCHGDAGAVTTNTEFYIKMQMLADQGRRVKDQHEIIGYNYRLDTVQAEVLLRKLPHLNEYINQRRRHALLYDEHLPNHIIEQQGAKHAYHLYVIKIKQRQKMIEHLRKNGIETGVHYPIPLHMQQAYASLGFGRYPVTEQLASEVLSIPMYPELSRESIEFIIKTIQEGLQ